MLPFTAKTFGSVTVKAEGDDGETAHPLISVTVNEYVPAHKLSNNVSVPEIIFPSTKYGKVPPEIDINSDALQKPKH